MNVPKRFNSSLAQVLNSLGVPCTGCMLNALQGAKPETRALYYKGLKMTEEQIKVAEEHFKSTGK
jgi:hypothetical protein